MRTHLIIVAIASLVACAKPAGGPLAYTFDNTKIAAVPLEQKQPVVEAQQQHDMALLARANAGATYRDSEIEMDLAEYQAERAEVVSHVVASRQPDAKPAAPSTETAALARRTADAKVAFIRARRSWLEKLAESTLYAVYAAQAKLELERARVAQANRLTAADFNLDAFQKQADRRAQAATVAAEATASRRTTAEAKLAEWSELERSYLKASAIMGPLESERFAGQWQPRTPAPAATPATDLPPPPPPPPATDAAMPAEQPATP